MLKQMKPLKLADISLRHVNTRLLKKKTLLHIFFLLQNFSKFTRQSLTDGINSS
jgi:hypothetical protein